MTFPGFALIQIRSFLVERGYTVAVSGKDAAEKMPRDAKGVKNVDDSSVSEPMCDTIPEIRAMLWKVHEALDRKSALCDQLEEIADCLPLKADPKLCRHIARRLVPVLQQTHRFEEDALFPALLILSPSMGTSTVNRLKSEHAHDEWVAEDVTEELLRIGKGEEVSNPDALGFMLRAFFETVRRHVALDKELICAVDEVRQVQLALRSDPRL